MKRLYCGIDLHARSLQVCVIDARLRILLERKLPCDLALLLELLAPFPGRISIAVESTFNWYWLVDGLQEAGYDVHLAHTLALSRITKAKVKTDRRDAFTLAKYLLNGDLPEAYIYPKQTRPVRDLVRQRQRLVEMRAREFTALRLRLYQHGCLDHSRNACRTSDPEDFSDVLADPRLAVLFAQEGERIGLLSRQVQALEDRILHAASADPAYLRLTQIPGLGKTLAAVHAARCYPKIRSLYDRTAARHPGRGSKLIAINVLGHKLATAAFKMLTEGTDYDETLIFGN